MRRLQWALPLSLLMLAGCRPNAVWSPDGKQLALDPRGTLMTFNTETRQFKQHTRGPGHSINPAWSPDGSRIAFYRLTIKDKAAAAIDLLSLDTASGTVKPLILKLPLVQVKGDFPIQPPPELLRESLSVSWSPDGSRLAYTAYKGSEPTLWVANADGTGAKAILTDREIAYTPQWSPDGSRIAFMHITPEEPAVDVGQAPPRDPSKVGSAGLDVVDPDGGNRKTLWDFKTRGSLTPFGPAPVWTADSRALRVMLDVDKKENEPFPRGGALWNVPVDGEPTSIGEIGGPSPFVSMNGSGAAFFIAPADQMEQYPRVAFTASQFKEITQLGVLDAATLGVKDKDAQEVDTFPVPSLSPDGKRIAIAFVPKTGAPVLLTRSTEADGKYERLVIPIASAQPAKPAVKKPAAKKPVKKRR